jgi:beta-galactosidase
VDASLGEGWYYEGAGIYRNVTLVSAAQAHVPQWGVCVRSKIAGVNADLEITTRLANGGDAPLSATLRQSVIAPDGTTVATIAEARFDIPAKSDVEWAGHAPLPLRACGRWNIPISIA